MFEYSDVENVNDDDLRKVIAWLQNQSRTQSEQLDEVMEKLENIESELVPSKKKKIANTIIKGVFAAALASLG